ncbi:MAG: hypothetical protein VYE22_18020 [Myxococcota bacterium]|nr:hypothetical protein [Myxococcota bacterium]
MMTLVEKQRRALEELRRALAEFLRGEIDASIFIPHYRSLFAPFDPPGLAAADLSPAERHELDVYVELMGGWFGENDEAVPRRADWRYGVDVEPHSWVDQPAYRRSIIRRLAEAGLSLDRLS